MLNRVWGDRAHAIAAQLGLPLTGSPLPVVLHPDPVLRAVCTPASGDLRQLAADMLATMYAAPGRGLAAPQIGQTIRLFVMDSGWKDGHPQPIVAINPEIVAPSAKVATQEEGCLSIPGHPVRVTRPAEITLGFTDLLGGAHSLRLHGFDAACAQHETDHLNGRLILDYET